MNIFPFKSSIKLKDRHSLNMHRSGLLWFTGLSGSGKSTLAHAVEAKLHEIGIRCYVLDGDNIRKGINKDLTLSPEDRKENNRRIAEIAKIMVDSGVLVFASFINPYKETRQYIRELMKNWPYFECYVKCAIEICEQRDPKGIYKKARAGEIKNMTGIHAPYEEPENPDLIIDTDKLTLDQSVDTVITFLHEQQIIYSMK